MYHDAGEFIRSNTKAADDAVTSGSYVSKGVSPGAILTAVEANRLIYDVRPRGRRPRMLRSGRCSMWASIRRDPDAAEKAAVLNVAP